MSRPINCPTPLPEGPADARLAKLLVPAPYVVPEKKAKKKATGTRKSARRQEVSDSSSDGPEVPSSHEDEAPPRPVIVHRIRHILATAARQSGRGFPSLPLDSPGVTTLDQMTLDNIIDTLRAIDEDHDSRSVREHVPSQFGVNVFKALSDPTYARSDHTGRTHQHLAEKFGRLHYGICFRLP